MAIAGDIKALFDYIFKNNLLTEDLVKKLQDKEYCSDKFSSGKYSILLKYDKEKSHQEQRKYGTKQARYYEPENYIAQFNGEEFLFTSQLYEVQRKHFYSWFKQEFSIDPEVIISQNTKSLNDSFKEFVKNKLRDDILSLNEFYFKEAQKSFVEFKEYGQGESKSFFEEIYERFLSSNLTFKDYLPSVSNSTKEYSLLVLLGKVVAHFDFHGFNKSIWNLTSDKRVLGKTSVRQTDWVRTLVQYKINSNDASSIKEGSIKNAVDYIMFPQKELTMLSEKHRKQFSEKILEKEYDPETFVLDVKEYFSNVVVPLRDEDNLTAYLCAFLYDDSIKKMWLEDNEKLEDLPMKDEVKKTPLNVIYYGPPGTGKTFRLTNEISKKFTRFEKASNAVVLTEVFSDMPWWRVIACVLIDTKKGMTVSEINEHEFIRIRMNASESNSVRQTLWGNLQSRTVLESKNVNVKERRAPYFFDKNEESEWFLAGNWKEELSEEIDLVNNVRSGGETGVQIKRYELVTFHPSYSYEDFVEGIKPVMDEEGSSNVNYTLVNGIFKRMCLKASEDPTNNYAVFIDEINRGNIPAIFGELITLIEDDKREVLSTILPYSKKPFTVPKNLFIYGTMNTADKSVEALDLALRRRFVFEELEPKTSEINCKYNPEIIKKIHETINLRIEALLGKDFRIGHSYFMNGTIEDLESLKRVFEYKIIPLLKEYFYEDWDKLCMVIGKKFVEKVNKGRIKFARSYEDSSNDFEDKNIYKISDSRDWSLQTFKSIYED